MTEHDQVRMQKALDCDLDNHEAVADAVRGLQSTDDPALTPLHDLLLARMHKLQASPKRSVPKKKYRDKVRQRLTKAQELLDNDRLQLVIQVATLFDKDKLQRLIQGAKDKKRHTPRETGSPTIYQEIYNSIDHVKMLLHQDVPALLDALEGN